MESRGLNQVPPAPLRAVPRALRLARRSLLLATGLAIAHAAFAATPDAPALPTTSATLPSLRSVRILDGPFADAIGINRTYLLAHDPDRLLAPFLREAGLEATARPYGNWESGGLDGHTAGHYLSALATMIAQGADTPDGALRRRLDHMLAELLRCQQASPDGYLGGVPGSRELWRAVADGRVEAMNRKWVPWYNLHKLFAGLRDAWILTGDPRAREALLRCANWCGGVVAGLSEGQMQRMLDQEHGGMNEVLADVYVISGDPKHLDLARRFNHRAVLDPLVRQEDQLTGKHANTQIPKVVGLQRIAALTHDDQAASGARFFWETVTSRRTVAFGGNSVSEHFNDPGDFRKMLEHREGPETCNTYNMLRLTEQLFASTPKAAYVDYYERALYNHILASIHPAVPGYVYFTPIRPAHYRVYSQPEKAFWCCVGTGMENPGRYGEFIYALAAQGLYVNLFIPSELSVTNLGLKLRQETRFPDEPRTRLTLRLEKPTAFTLHLRHPGWVAQTDFAVRLNGQPVATGSAPSSFATLSREWHDGDRLEIDLPLRTTVEPLPDGSGWVALLRGPLVLAAPAGTNQLTGLRANDSRMGHVAGGPLVPLDQVPVLLTTAAELPNHVTPDPDAGPLNFRLTDVVSPESAGSQRLLPFFRLHDSRYQMYWQLTTQEAIARQRDQLAAEERRKQARDAATLDVVAAGEQQSEVEHDFTADGATTGIRDGRRWRRGTWLQYVLDTRGEKQAELVVTYCTEAQSPSVVILANDLEAGADVLETARPGAPQERRYLLPVQTLGAGSGNRVTIRLSGGPGSRGVCVYEVRLLKPEHP